MSLFEFVKLVLVLGHTDFVVEVNIGKGIMDVGVCTTRDVRYVHVEALSITVPGLEIANPTKFTWGLLVVGDSHSTIRHAAVWSA